MSDNGPQFPNEHFRKFATTYYGIINKAIHRNIHGITDVLKELFTLSKNLIAAKNNNEDIYLAFLTIQLFQVIKYWAIRPSG